jgi:CRP-like cAMP-binding protein
MLETIKESELFKGVTSRVLTDIAKGCEEMSFGKGETIFEKGESSQDVYELLEGGVDLASLERSIIHLTVSRNGQIFGWSALVEPHLRTATAICSADTRVIRIPRDAVERAIERHPHEGIFILKNLMGIITTRLQLAYSYIYSFGGV